ncbi:MAG: hypothetical protein ACRD0K_05605 [Egibacteraceae bacterium]
MTARAGTALLAQTADWTGLTDALSAQLGGCRGWEVHDPGKVVRDIVVMPADGGDALRHLNALDGQEALFGQVADRLRAGLVTAGRATWGVRRLSATGCGRGW